VIRAKGYGFADIAQQEPATPDTPFYLASISKTFTATAVMQLWEQGFLDLDDDIDEYLPFSVRNPNFPDVPITFRMLLDHGSSIRSNFWTVPLTPGIDCPISLEDFVGNYLVPGGSQYDAIQNFNPFPPGAAFQYCNHGYAVLGYLVERISGEPFDQYCQDHIFAPLGMTNTSWRAADFPEFSIAPAMPYLYNHTTQSFDPFGFGGWAGYPAATLTTSANQLAEWLILHMNGGVYQGVQILQPDTVQLMQTPEYTGLVNAFFPGSAYGYGLGFITTDRGPQQREPAIGNGGLFFGSATAMWYRPNERVGVVMMANAQIVQLPQGGFQWIVGWEDAGYFFLVNRLLDEAAEWDGEQYFDVSESFDATSASGQSNACEAGSYVGFTSGGGCYVGLPSRNEARRQAVSNAQAACASFCGGLDACSPSRPTCRGTARVKGLSCSSCFNWGDPNPNWYCEGDYRCACACAGDR
jgi:CubicO group peptidase (beta-lactamase class C family)